MSNFLRKNRAIYLLLLIGFALIILKITRIDFWGDELYSMTLARRSYVDIWEITGADVHPPLYYWGLRTFALIFGESISSYRIFSGLIMVLTLLFAIPIKKHLNKKAAIVFLAVMILTPTFQFLASEIRMYSMVVFFSVGAAFYAYIAYTNKTKMKYWFVFTFFSICICYTQYFAAISLIFFYGYFMLYSLFFDKQRVKYIFGCGLFVTVFYIPWIPYVISQLSTVSDNYWIIDSMISWEKYIFYPIMAKTIPFEGTGYVLLRWLFLFLIIGTASLPILKKEMRTKNKESIIFALICILSYFSLLTFAYIISTVHKPLFIDKYSVCALGFLWIGLTLLISTIDFRKLYSKLLISSLILVAIVSIGFRLRSDYHYSQYINLRDQYIKSYLDKNLQNGDALLGFQAQGIYTTSWIFKYPNLQGFLYNKPAMSHVLNPQVIENISEVDSNYDRLIVIGLEHWQKDIVNTTSYKDIATQFELKHSYTSPEGDIIETWQRRK